MKQTGTFYTLTNNANGTETKSPLPNIYIYFSQNGVRKLTTQTSKAGKFDFDLPLGDYNVTYSQGASHNVYNLAGGSIFSLTAGSTLNEFEKWAMTPVYLKPEENPLVIRLAELAKIATDAATEAKAIQDAMSNGSSGTGKWVKESLIANMMNVGDFGFGGNALTDKDRNWTGSKFRIADGIETSTGTKLGAAVEIETGYANNRRRSIILPVYNSEAYLSLNAGVGYRLYSAYNTTVDSNGNIKAASPIIKLFNDHIESNDSFKEKPSLEKLSTGVYKISNTLGLAKEGWYIETPKDKNGLPYFMVDWEQDEESQDVIIRVFKKKLDLETLDFVNGDPVDIGQDQRWIDLRFHEEPEEHQEVEVDE